MPPPLLCIRVAPPFTQVSQRRSRTRTATTNNDDVPMCLWLVPSPGIDPLDGRRKRLCRVPAMGRRRQHRRRQWQHRVTLSVGLGGGEIVVHCALVTRARRSPVGARRSLVGGSSDGGGRDGNVDRCSSRARSRAAVLALVAVVCRHRRSRRRRVLHRRAHPQVSVRQRAARCCGVR